MALSLLAGSMVLRGMQFLKMRQWMVERSKYALFMEDLGNCFLVMYPGKKFILFTEWSQGHAWKCADGLKASDMNKSYGGCQVKSHASRLTVNEFGHFNNLGLPMINTKKVAWTTFYDIVIPGTDLVELLNECADFKNELTMLQYVGEQHGVEDHMSPKCHCEIAGKAVEIVWGISKNHGWCISLD